MHNRWILYTIFIKDICKRIHNFYFTTHLKHIKVFPEYRIAYKMGKKWRQEFPENFKLEEGSWMFLHTKKVLRGQFLCSHSIFQGFQEIVWCYKVFMLQHFHMILRVFCKILTSVELFFFLFRIFRVESPRSFWGFHYSDTERGVKTHEKNHSWHHLFYQVHKKCESPF